MSIIKKAAANILGIGGTKVDTIIHSTSIYPGGIVEGVIHISGGTVAQDVSTIVLEVNGKYAKKVEDNTLYLDETLQKIHIDFVKTIMPNERYEIPFSFTLTEKAPISYGKYKIWIETTLDIIYAVDSKDGDMITVFPSNGMNNVLDALERMGFLLKSIENTACNWRDITPYAFIQEFEFSPSIDEYRRSFNELEIYFAFNNENLQLYVEVDRKVKGLGMLLLGNETEHKTFISFTKEELNHIELIQQKLTQTLSKYMH